jgi:dTDP-4-dehydrorhamnose 3,5-epimerase
MEFTETTLKGTYLVRPQRHEDERGHFARAWCGDEFREHGLRGQMVQLNVGLSRQRGTLRGLHYQAAPHAEAKFVRCTRGAIYDVIVDLRRESPTFGKWVGAELTADNGLMLYSPEGFAHGCQSLEDNTEFYYLTSVAYVPEAARGLRYDDPVLGIQWPLPVSSISAVDRQWPDFASALSFGTSSP